MNIIPALTEWQRQIDQSNQMLETLIKPLMLAPESPVYESIWALQASLTAAVAKIVGDKSEWLIWYQIDNDMGRLALKASPVDGKPTRKIKSISDLAWLIQESK